MIVVTAGHVDHGKSTLIKALTGTDTDRLELEKERGLSIDLGFAYYHFHADSSSSTPREEIISFVDVPGHTDYANNMLAGVTSASTALLAISAVEGIKPQTREHLTILDLLGFNNGLITLTFADKVTPERLSEVEEETLALLSGTSLAHCPILAVAATTGEGIPAALAYLKTLRLNERPILNPNSAYVRYCIDRSFTLNGVGTVVTGTMISGIVNRETQLVHANSDNRARVKSLFRDKESINQAQQGDRIAIGVNLGHDQIQRGDWLVSPSLAFAVHTFDVRLRLAPHVNIEQLVNLRGNANLHLYIGSAHALVQLRLLQQDDQTYLVQIRSKQDIFASFGDRIIVRDGANQNTYAGGYVVDIFSPRRKPDSPSRLAQLEAMDNPEQDALANLVQVSEYGVSLERFAAARNLRAPQASKLLSNLEKKQVFIETFQLPVASSVGMPLPIALAAEHYERHLNVIITALSELHEKNPFQVGANEMALMISAKFGGNPALFSALCERMIDRELIVRTGPLLHLPNHEAPRDEEAQKLMQQIKPHLARANFVAPRVFELMEHTSLPRSAMERLLRSNVNTGNLVQLSRNRFYLPETVKALRALIEGLLHETEGAGISVVEFRDRTGIGRNLCVEILEYFDQQGLTLRRGNIRRLRTAAF